MNNPNSPVIITQPSSTTELMMNHDAMTNLYRLAETMAGGKATVPNHLQGNVADCMAVVMQAAIWGMNPFAVAQKTHVVNGTLGYEAQLVNAVAQSSGAISGRFHYEYQGEGANLSCRVGAVILGETEITWNEFLSMSSVTTKNSPLWKTNPKQQLGYLQVKNWARAFCPGAILGVYSDDELDFTPKEMRDVTPKRTSESLQQVLDNAEARPTEQQKALPTPFETLSLSLNDCTTLEELNEVAASIGEAVKVGKVNDSERKHLGSIYNNRKAKLEPQVDTETGEIHA